MDRTLSKGTKWPRLRSIAICFWELWCGALEFEANGTLRRPTSRTAAPGPASGAAMQQNYGDLYLTCSRITCCLTGKVTSMMSLFRRAEWLNPRVSLRDASRRRRARRESLWQEGMLTARDLHNVGRMSRTERTRLNGGFAS